MRVGRFDVEIRELDNGKGNDEGRHVGICLLRARSDKFARRCKDSDFQGAFSIRQREEGKTEGEKGIKL